MLLSAVFLFTVISFSIQDKTFSKLVNTTSGPVRGEEASVLKNNTVYRYLGIPYARANRFESPKEVIRSDEIFVASHYGKACPQATSPFGVQDLEETSEDCLTLNIFTPKCQTRNLPVLVYIGGLFYSFGKANSTSFDPSVVASRGSVIVVSLNYRLGVFGFLRTDSSVIKGNYGLEDQIEALKWLNRNIQRFGGNPDDVTVVGHWSGATSVGLLLVSPKARGLFKHVILMSGSPLSLTATLDHVTAAERSRKFNEQLKCTNQSNLRACLRSKSVSDLLVAQEKVHNVPIMSPFAPVVDGGILPDFPDVLFKTAKQINAKSVMIGIVEDDGAIFLSPSLPGMTNHRASSNQGFNQSTLHEIIQTSKLTKTSAVTRLINYKYTNWENPSDERSKQQLVDLYTDASFSAPAIRLAHLVSGKQIATFFYHIQKDAFNTTMLPRIPIGSGVAYGDDLRLLFDSTFTYGDMRESQGGIVGQAFGMLMAFVKTGNPTPSSKPLPLRWPTYNPNGHYISIGKSNITVQSKFLSDRMAFWNDLLPSMTSQALTNTAKPTISATTSNHGNENKCIPEKDKTTKALTAVVAVMAIVIVIMLSIIVYQTRMLSKRQDIPPLQQDH